MRAAIFVVLWETASARWCQVENVKADVYGNYTFAGSWRLDGCTTLALDHGMCAEEDCPHRNKFGDEEIVQLADHLHGNSGLTALSISSNKITDESAIAIAEALRGNEILTDLNLQHNQIGDRGAIALAEVLESNAVFTVLNLQHNLLTDEGGRVLLAALQSNNSGFETLYVAHNQMSEELLAEVAMENKQAFTPPAGHQGAQQRLLPKDDL